MSSGALFLLTYLSIETGLKSTGTLCLPGIISLGATLSPLSLGFGVQGMFLAWMLQAPEEWIPQLCRAEPGGPQGTHSSPGCESPTLDFFALMLYDLHLSFCFPPFIFAGFLIFFLKEMTNYFYSTKLLREVKVHHGTLFRSKACRDPTGLCFNVSLERATCVVCISHPSCLGRSPGPPGAAWVMSSRELFGVFVCLFFKYHK